MSALILSVSVPEMVNTPALTVETIPEGKPLTVAPVAPPENAYVIGAIDSPSQMI